MRVVQLWFDQTHYCITLRLTPKNHRTKIITRDIKLQKKSWFIFRVLVNVFLRMESSILEQSWYQMVGCSSVLYWICNPIPSCLSVSFTRTVIFKVELTSTNAIIFNLLRLFLKHNGSSQSLIIEYRVKVGN